MKTDGNGLTRRQILVLSSLAGGVSIAGPAWGQFKLGKIKDAVTDVVKAETISDADLKEYFDQAAEEMDRLNPLLTAKDPYGKRLAALSKGLESYDGLALDIKGYNVIDINAFAMGNGTIRVFRGLMDEFTDDEIRYVIAHEIGHVKNGHSKKRMQAALRTSALKNAASAASGTVAQLSESELGDLFNQVVAAQHSQGNEKQADDYAMAFMKAKQYDANACVTALDKLAAMDNGGGPKWLSTHPAPKDRAKRMRSQLTG
jgi:metalloprotease